MKALLLVLPAAVLVACGSTTNTTGGAATPTAEPTSAPTASAAATATPAPATAPPTAASTPAPPAGVVVATGSAGAAGTVLVNAQGHTLYRFTPEAHGAISCTSGCTGTWMPVTVPSGQQVQPQGSLSGTFTLVTRPEGTRQAAYNGWPLYAFAGDSAGGTANGQGIAGKWFAVTPTVAAAGM